MKVKEIMDSNPKFIEPDMSLAQAAAMFRDNDFGFLPVGDPEQDRLVGTITDRDIVIYSTAQGMDPNTTKAKDIMRNKVWYCFEEDDVNQAAKYMEKCQVHRLIVLNEAKRLTGIVSIGDIARQCKNDELCGQIMEAISKAA